ncbi:hypothetical protein CEP04_24870 [Klebsiella pneumoniae]|nr:hypothetical protein CEP04_24870 [Klebsiella pneumoniae]
MSLERVKPPGLFFSAIGIALGNSGSGNAFLSLYIDFMITMLMNYCFLLLIKSQFRPNARGSDPWQK